MAYFSVKRCNFGTISGSLRGAGAPSPRVSFGEQIDGAEAPLLQFCIRDIPFDRLRTSGGKDCRGVQEVALGRRGDFPERPKWRISGISGTLRRAQDRRNGALCVGDH